MEQFYILDDLQAKIEMEQVLKFIDCTPDSPVYEDFREEYQEIIEEVGSLIKPVGILGFGQLSKQVATEKYQAGTKVLYAVISVGDGASKASTKAFGEGNYVRGMLWDAIADVALFSLEKGLQEKVREVCALRQVGVKKRLEAPQDISMEVQKEAWETLRLKERMGMDISSGFMLNPVKSSCQVFVLTDDETLFKVQHDCRNCSNVNCKLRNIPKAEIIVRRNEEEVRFLLEDGESLMDGLIREGFYISAVCGGKGRCGKCKVRVLEGTVPVSSEDAKFFSKNELELGWRLSCMIHPLEDLVISFELEDEAEFEAVSDFTQLEKSPAAEGGKNVKAEQSDVIWEDKVGEPRNARLVMAVDIGTTTIAFQLLDENGAVLGTVTTINNQRKYGADVISRMQASVEGKKAVLQESIRKDLREGIRILLENCERKIAQVQQIVIGCNTTMSHLLMGYDCDSLGVYPFTPVNVDFIRGSFKEIIGLENEGEVMILPGISTYVGGDIVSGLYACGFDKSDEICLLVDLGTNGEMALGNREKILVTSTAAGPAFEGGNITWGMGSVSGAICSVKLEKEGNVNTCGDPTAIIGTIRDKSPIGICGTGVVEAVAEMLREEIIDEMGLLAEEYFEQGFPLATTEDGEQIALTQKDIRELQLAKAAVRAGIETLLLRYGVSKEQVSKVYLAGGFGYRLDVEKASAIGMLPEELICKTQAVGNASLAGAVKFLGNAYAVESLQKIIAVSEEIGLSMDQEFNEFYMDSMLFE